MTTPVKSARFLFSRTSGAGAAWRIYELTPPMVRLVDAECPTCKHDTLAATADVTHVVVSANNVPFGGPETYIFPSDADGNVEDWLELPGSFKGGMDHAEALANAGYEVTA